MTLPLYRPEITTYEQDGDGQWFSKHGAFTHTLFCPMSNEHRAKHGAFRRDVLNGWLPSFTIETPEGAYLSGEGFAAKLRTAEGRIFDGIQCLIMAKRGEEGFRLVLPPAPRLEPPAPRPREETRRVEQLSLFGDLVEAKVNRTPRERRLAAKGGAYL